MSCDMVQSMYIAEGFMVDCELLTRTLTDKYDMVDWPKFCQEWKELQFDKIFCGRSSGAELVELTEELLQCARLYLVTETDKFEDQVVGLFITYAVITIQPYKGLCSLRLTPQDVAPLKRFEARARRDGRTDALLVLARVYVYSTHYHAAHRDQAMDSSIRKYFDDTTRVPKAITRRWHGQLDRRNLRSWERVAATEHDYDMIKRCAKEVAESMYPGANVLLDTYKPAGHVIADSLRKLIQGQSQEPKKEEDTYGITSVKKKALKNKVEGMKHLSGVNERQCDINNSPQKNIPEEKTPWKYVPRQYKPKKKISEKEDSSIINIRDAITKPSDWEAKDDVPTIATTKPVVDPLSIIFNREGSPEAPFKGFTNEEIKNSDLRKESSILSKAADLPNLSFADYVGDKWAEKPQNSLNMIIKDMNESERLARLAKRKKNYPMKGIKRKHPCTNSVFSDSDIYTMSSIDYHSDTSDEAKAIERNLLDIDLNTEDQTEEFDQKELDIDVKGTIVQHELNDIIQTDKEEPQEKDIEIEYIDNYTGDTTDKDIVVNIDNFTVTNAFHKKNNDSVSGCKKGHRNTSDDVSPDISENIVSAQTNTNNKSIEKTMAVKEHETIEVFQIVDDTEAQEFSNKHVISKKPKKLGRRNQKQSRLRSKFKKMGILPVANFDCDSIN